MNLQGINHLAFITSDMVKTIRFYRDLLNLKLSAGIGHDGYRHYFLQISDTDLLAFFEWPGVEPVPNKVHGQPIRGPFIFDHVSFGVEAEEDLWELTDKLQAAGFHVSDVIDHGFIHSLYAYDPNGIPIEFSHNVEGIDIRHSTQMKDQAPSRTALEGPEPQPEKWPKVKEPTPVKERLVFPGAGSELFHGKR